MLDFNSIKTIALDIAGRNETFERQDALSDLIWLLLEKNYSVFLFSSTDEDDLAAEKFLHPHLTILQEKPLPGEALTSRFPALTTPGTLWVTEDRGLQKWIAEQGFPCAFRKGSAALERRGIRYGSLADLGQLLDPSRRVLRDLGHWFRRRGAGAAGGPRLVGIGGPPLSDFQRFTVDLKGQLETEGLPLVELLDLSSFLKNSEDADGSLGWRDAAAGEWIVEEVLRPLRDGRRVYVETLPQGIPRDFEPHLPLFLSEVSVVLIFAEMLFTAEIAGLLDVSILLEVSPGETARRLYEIPAGQRFDPKFTAQYLAHDGRPYRDYLLASGVAEKATIRISAEVPQVFTFLQHPLS